MKKKEKKEKIKNKLKKYIDYRGMVAFCVYFNTRKMPHAFSVIGYKENKEKWIINREILNPWHFGDYIGNNIKKNEEYNKLKIWSENKKLFDEAKTDLL